jgi:two-component system nitrogen regulation response regulator GlnG
MLIPDFLPEAVVRGELPAAPVSQSGPTSELQRIIDSSLRVGSNNLYAESLASFERYLLTRVLRETDGNQSKAAEILGITRGTLRQKIRTLGISIGQVVKTSPPADS